MYILYNVQEDYLGYVNVAFFFELYIYFVYAYMRMIIPLSTFVWVMILFAKVQKIILYVDLIQMKTISRYVADLFKQLSLRMRRG